MAARTLVLADLHLCRETDPRVAADLARLAREHAGDRLVFAGDLFDVSSERARRSGRTDVASALASQPEVRAALARHVDADGELWLVAGNHDAELGAGDDAAVLAAALGASPSSARRIRVTPWFFREGALHIEHGHLYDPDNAPAHPLVMGHPSLGVHFTEQFIARTGAYAYLNANDAPPLQLLLSAFRWYGVRAPHVVYRYFHAAIAAMLQSGPWYRARHEKDAGAARIRAFSDAVGLPPDVVQQVLAQAAVPTLESLADTFSRLYFDRVLATVAMAAGLGTVAAGGRRLGAASFGLGALMMALSWSRGHDRYSGNVTEQLRAGARRVASASGARLVIFGHTHREALEDEYANTGSFAFPRGAPGRPFLEIEGDRQRPRAVRRYLTRAR